VQHQGRRGDPGKRAAVPLRTDLAALMAVGTSAI
jgi:hypothetical protein